MHDVGQSSPGRHVSSQHVQYVLMMTLSAHSLCPCLCALGCLLRDAMHGAIHLLVHTSGPLRRSLPPPGHAAHRSILASVSCSYPLRFTLCQSYLAMPNAPHWPSTADVCACATYMIMNTFLAASGCVAFDASITSRSQSMHHHGSKPNRHVESQMRFGYATQEYIVL